MALSPETEAILDGVADEIAEAVKDGPITDDQDRFLIVDADPDYPLVPLIDRADFEPFEVERTAKGRYLLIPLSAGEFSMEEAREVAHQASRAYGHHGVREVSLWPKVGLHIALYDPPSPRPSWW